MFLAKPRVLGWIRKSGKVLGGQFISFKFVIVLKYLTVIHFIFLMTVRVLLVFYYLGLFLCGLFKCFTLCSYLCF